MSDSNRSTLAYLRESTWGVALPDPIDLKRARFTKESFEHVKLTERSAEIREDRMLQELVEVGQDATGGFEFEWSVGTLDDFLESALQGTFTDVGGTLTLLNGTTRTSYIFEKKLDTGAYVSFPGVMVDTLMLNLASRKIVTGSITTIGLRGYSSANSICNRAVGTLTFSGQPTADDTVTLGATTYVFKGSVASTANQVLIGATEAITIANLAAAINATASGSGVTYGSATTANASATAIASSTTLKAVATVAGTSGNSVASTEAGSSTSWGAATLLTGAALDAATTGPILSASANVGSITEGGSALSSIKNLSLTISSNLRGNDVIGQKTIDQVGVGSISVTGKVDAYFRSKALLDKFIDHTATAIVFEVSREASGAVSGDHIGYRVTLPRVKYGKGTPMATGKDSDIMQPLEFEAEADVSSGAVIKIEKLKKA